MWAQRRITLEARPRGVHLVGSEVERALPELREVRIGLLHLHHHLFRHGAISVMKVGTDPRAVQDYAGWTTLRQMQRYGHVTNEELGKCVDTTRSYVESIRKARPSLKLVKKARRLGIALA